MVAKGEYRVFSYRVSGVRNGFLCLILVLVGRGGSVADRLMDPSSETTYARLGIGAGEFPGPSPIIACASTRAIISRQLKTDAIPTEDGQLYQIQKKGGGGMCVCVCVKI